MSELSDRLLQRAKALRTPPRAAHPYADARPAVELLIGKGWSLVGIHTWLAQELKKKPAPNSSEWWQIYRFIRRVKRDLGVSKPRPRRENEKAEQRTP